MCRTAFDNQAVLTPAKADSGPHAIPFLRPSKIDCGSWIVGKQLAQRANSWRRLAKLQFSPRDLVGHPRHAVRYRIGKSAHSTQSKRQVQPAVPHAEQDGREQPVRLAKRLVAEVEKARTVAMQNEQCHGARHRRLMPLEQLAGRGVGEPGQGGKRVAQLAGARLQSRLQRPGGPGEIVKQYLLCAADAAVLPPIQKACNGTPKETLLRHVPDVGEIFFAIRSRT